MPIKLLAICLSILFFCSLSEAAVSKSDNFSLESSSMTSGLGDIVSSQFSLTQSVGSPVSSSSDNDQQSVSDDFKLEFSYLNTLPAGEVEYYTEPTQAYDIDFLLARTEILGSLIKESTWQKDNDPYFYWDTPGTGIDIFGYSYALDKEPDDIIDTIATAYQYLTDTIPDGEHTFTVKAQNTAGTWGKSKSFTLWIDTSAPEILDYRPDSGTIINEAKPEIWALLRDLQSGLTKENLSLKVNNKTVSFDFDADSGKVSYTPKKNLYEGENTFYLTAEDAIGNEITPLLISFTVDTEGPEASIIINNGEVQTTSVYVSLEFDVEDKVSDIAEMIISNDGIFDTETWEPFTKEKEKWLLDPVSGLKTVSVKFKDSVGNVSSIAQDSIELIVLSPETYIVSGPTGIISSTEAMFTFSASKPGAKFKYKFDNDQWSEWIEDIYVSKTGFTNGNHYFQVKSGKDVDGNTVIDIDEEDLTPASRVWTVQTETQPATVKEPVKLWRVE